MEEYNEIAAHIKQCHNNGKEIQTNQLFNLSILNVLWRIVTGKRYDLNVRTCVWYRKKIMSYC